MSNKDHSFLGPSTAHRWLFCTPSRRLEEELEKKTDSVGITSSYAQEGEVAHALAQLKLLEKHYKFLYKEEDYNNFVNSDAYKTYYNQEMEECVNDYVAYITDKMTDDNVLLIENSIDLSEWVPFGKGTVDAVLLGSEYIEVIDFKYGRGVYVSAFENPQLMLYALGVIKLYPLLDDLKVSLTIFQPRKDNISTYEAGTVKDILKWGEEIVRPNAELAYRGLGEFMPSEQTCQWCKLKNTCKARAEYTLNEAKMAFGGKLELSTEVVPELPKFEQLSDLEISNILTASSVLKNWLKDIEDGAFEKLSQGGTIPNYKLVERVGYRTLINEEIIIDGLKRLGYNEEDYLEPAKIKTLTNLEKLVGKKKFGEIFHDCIGFKPSTIVLVRDSDPRPAIEFSSTEDTFR